VGVEYEQGGTIKIARANREVIIAASTINSPKLLQLSGIGAPEHLKAAGITPIHQLPGVGENLQDHLEVYFQVECLKPVSLYPKLNLFSKGLIGLEWLLFKRGLGATNHFESCGFIRSKAGIEYPDIQYHFLPIAIRYDGKAVAGTHSFQVHVGPMRSKSRGFVRARSSDPREAPSIRFNYMSHEDDWTEFRNAMRLTREIFEQKALEPYKGRELQPGEHLQTDEELDSFIRDHAESAYHPCGTCRMGSSADPMAVVDPHCRVIGMEGLRVADSSIMPRVTNGNLNGPTLMIGEKASDHILGVDQLPPSNQEAWVNPKWETSQR
jgi:choline dehydrogenase